MLQVLGLTYANIRARAVAIVGEPVVQALEQTAEVFRILITQGPGGLWEYIKEKLGNLRDMVLEGIKSFVIERIKQRGDEVCAHGRTNSESLGGLWEHDEARIIEETTEVIARHFGKRPKGWMGPAAAESGRTPDLLVEAGYTHSLGWPVDDQPIWMRTRSGPLLIVPYPMELNDIGANIHRDHTGREFADMVVDQFEEMIEQSERAYVWGNNIAAVGYGIVVVNGRHAAIVQNDIASAAVFGVFACDRDGLLLLNHFRDSFIGLIFCKVPAGAVILPGGEATGAALPATNWVAKWNNATGNLWGYLAIDGATGCSLILNDASNNSAYDIELAGESMRFGFLTPTSSNCTAITADPSITVKNCGVNNTVIGGNQIDTGADPCF